MTVTPLTLLSHRSVAHPYQRGARSSFEATSHLPTLRERGRVAERTHLGLAVASSNENRE